MIARSIIATVLASAVIGCSLSGGSTQPNGALPERGAILPQVLQPGTGAQWVQFNPHTLGALYSAIVLGPDNNIWFLDENAASLVKMTGTGGIKEFSLSGTLTGNGVSMTVGADKNFYILDESANVVRVTPTGSAKSFAIPSGDSTSIDSLGRGPDGNVWFAESNHIAYITPSGTIKEFPYPTGYAGNQYGGVTAGSDGNVWFAHSSGDAIGRIVPSTHKITMFHIPVACTPAPVVLAKDNNVWFTCLTTSPTIGRITTSGAIATYNVGGKFNSNETEQFCARGPDGQPWCASGNDGNIFRINTATHTVTTFTPPLASLSRPDALAAGADGNVWVDTVGESDEIAVFVSNPMTVTPNKLTFSGPRLTQTLSVNEHGVASWTAKTSNPAVATVAQGSSSASFKGTSVGAGTCKFTISDAMGNSVAVKVTVK